MADDFVKTLYDKYPDDSDPVLQSEIDSIKRKLNGEDSDENVKRRKSSDAKKMNCELCGKDFRLRNSYNRHIKGHRATYSCSTCGRTFNRRHNLKVHEQRVHLQQMGGAEAQLPPVTDRELERTRQTHETTDDNLQTSVNNSSKTVLNGNNIQQTSANDNSKAALNGSVVEHRLLPQSDDRYDLLAFFTSVKDEVIRTLNRFSVGKSGIKFYLDTVVTMVRQKPDGTTDMCSPHFRSKNYAHLSSEPLTDHVVNEACQKMFASMEQFVRKGSGWSLQNVLHTDVMMMKYAPLRGNSYLEVPTTLRKTNALVNVKNHDDKCFLYCVLAHLHPVKRNPNRIQHYRKYMTELKTEKITFPMTISQVGVFENLNNISVNIFGFEENEIFPLRITKLTTASTHVNILYLKRGEKSHYVLIKNLNRFLSRTIGYNTGTRYFCHFCLQSFHKKTALKNHTTICSEYGAQRVEFPEPGVDDVMEFTDFQKQMRVPMAVIADFETFNKSVSSPVSCPDSTNTTEIAHMQPCAFGYQVVSSNPLYTKEPVIYRGPNVVERFIDCLLKECEEIEDILSDIKPMNFTKEDRIRFETATHCHICKKAFTSDNPKVRDHDHLTGSFRNAACQSCNLNFQYPDFIPVCFHNLSNFDGHILCQAIGKFKKENITVIPNNMEKYISFSLGKLRFIDTFRFLGCSLDKLASNLKKAGESKFNHFNKSFPSATERSLLMGKQFFPYDYIQDETSLKETRIPPQEAFYNKLTSENLSDENYQHVQKVWSTMKIRSLDDYLKLYLRVDVLILADVIENFRDMCQTYYELDPLHYYTAPNLAFSACLKMTGVQLQLLTDPDQHLFFENAIRGGISMVSKRYCKANHPHLGDKYNEDLPNTYIMYYDVNNLYGYCMQSCLPTGCFRWLKKSEIETLDISSVPADGDKGYVLEISGTYDTSLHDFHNDFPICPEKREVTDAELSPYSKRLWREANPADGDELLNRPRVRKLVPNLYDKEKYTVHYRTLQLYMSLGLKVTNIHRVIEFTQSPWLKPYVDFNTAMRKEATTDFDRDFWKLMINAVYGKQMENLRNRQNVKLVHLEKTFKKLAAMPSFDYCRIFNENLVGVSSKKVKLMLNRPLYVGMCILDLAKYVVYDWHYNFMKKQYGNDVEVLYTDTDSFLYEIRTANVYSDMALHMNKFDTSNYPKHDPLYNAKNAKVIGLMKDEAAGKSIVEFVALRPKLYSYLTVDETGEETEHKRAKGVVKSVVEKRLRHHHYKRCLFQGTSKMCSMNMIRSKNHELYMLQQNKLSLSAFEDKRYVLSNGVDSLAYGHYQIPSQE